MTILYFGIYNPNYSRNRVLIKGLKENGVDVLECNVPYRSWVSYSKLLLKYFLIKKEFDAMIVGFPGQEVMLLARLLTFRFGSKQAKKPIIFDVFTSHYGGYILDRKKFSKKSLRAKWYKWLDKKSVELSDVSLLDTNAHIDFFVKEFGLPREKFKRIFVGTDSGVFYPREIKKTTDKFLVHFHGNFIPLQGVSYIIQAAKLLENENVEFNIIGRGQTYKRDCELAEKLKIKNINFIEPVSYSKLSDYINSADIALGIFGNTLKTNLVIPNKIYEAIACAKPVITADTPAVRELLKDGENVLLCRNANPEDLAKKILLFKHNPEFLHQVGQKGYLNFKNESREVVLGNQLIQIIKNSLS
jgi:glycosyltransferase involved in cell wall biosynthesis